MKYLLDLNSTNDYRRFLRIKGLPQRRFYGCELKPEYYQQACVNLKRAEMIQADSDSGAGLFDVLEIAA